MKLLIGLAAALLCISLAQHNPYGIETAIAAVGLLPVSCLCLGFPE